MLVLVMIPGDDAIAGGGMPTYSGIGRLLRWNPDSGGFSGPMLGVVCGAQS